MKKIKTLMLIIIISCTLGISKTNAQAVEEGTVLIDAYYGFPNLWTSFLKSAYTEDNTTGISNEKIGSFGPAGGRFEYLLSDKFGLGVDVLYSTTSIEWREEGLNTSTIYTYKVSVPRFRVVPRMNLHFSQNDKLDVYGVFGIGYLSLKYKFETNDPDYIEEEAKNWSPIAFRLGLGMRYFFTDNIGAGLEFGLGCAGLTAGLAVKL